MKRSNTGDDVFIHAPPEAVFRMIASMPRECAWWPGARVLTEGNLLRIRIPSARRPSRAIRFSAHLEHVRPGVGLVWTIERGEVRGRGEWWFEPYEAGTIAHYLLDVSPGTRGRVRRWPSKVRRHRWAVRRGVNALKDRLETAGAPQNV